MSSRELQKQIQILENAGVDTKNFEVDYHVKFSLPFSGLIFAIMGVPLGIRFSRGGKAPGIIISIVLVFLYYVLYSLFRSLGRGGLILPIASAWVPNILFALLGVYLVFQTEKS